MKKCILLLLDGIGDRSHAILRNKTPLQKARTPALNSLARSGSNGLYHAMSSGICLPSEIAHFIIFGYSINEFPGRGSLEALGNDIDLPAGSIAILAHLASVKKNESYLILNKNNENIDKKELTDLISSIQRYSKHNQSFFFHQTKGHHGILVVSGDASRYITDSDPILPILTIPTIKPWQEFSDDQASLETARNLTSYIQWTYHVLNNHPVNIARKAKGLAPLNICLTQRAGTPGQIMPIHKRYGLKSLLISSSPIYKGIAQYIGMEHIMVENIDSPEDEISRKLSLAINKIQDFDFIHIHTKTPDEAGHLKDPVIKKNTIEAIDRGIKKHLKGLKSLKDLLLIVMADHSTASSGTLIHSGEPVPVIFHGDGMRIDRVSRYDEVSAANGALSLMSGNDIMNSILNYLDRAKLMGLRDNPVDLPYWPGGSEPLSI